MKTQKIIAGIRAGIAKKKVDVLAKKIQTAMAVKGKGRELLENLGKELKQSGDIYKDCKNSGEASAILLAQLDRILGQDILRGDHQVIYKSDELLLISIDGTFYEITGSDMQSTAGKFARAAGVPSVLIGVQLAKLIVEGLIKFWQRYDPKFNEKASRLIP